ncbi:MAG TPA: L-aspartate oxidase [Opitutus sp.]|nr:L-aspartate oxidase [Opitutus sp.]
MQIHRTDCLVIGAGLAGSAYALHMARRGFSVELLSLSEPLAANSDWAQGGIIYDTNPDPASLARDIVEASDRTANPAAVEQLVREGPSAVKELLLDDLHVGFDRDAKGALDFTREGGHSERRIIHAKDATGHAILQTVAERVNATPRIARRTGCVAIDLLTLSHNSENPADKYQPLTCFGAYVLNTVTQEVSAIVAKKTVLATGGLGQIFLHSTNQPGTVGHGVAMAYRVGARLVDLEYVQFHPTVFAKKNAPRFLITEALRGEGGVLVNARGERFMDAADPRGSLAPRDVVARAIKQELAASGEPCVFLDVSAMKPEFLRERFPNIYERCFAHGVDITREPIPVVPAAHFACGGVHTDLAGRTSVCHLNAIGETACTGLHGANRLASTSLLECLTSAKFTAIADAEEIAAAETPEGRSAQAASGYACGPFHLPDPRPWASPTRVADPVLVRQDMLQIQHTMWNYAGVVRSPRRLTRARRILLELREEIQSFYRGCHLTRELIELRNAVQTALLVVHAAALNPRSKGCHYVVDEE